ncbi:MAG: TIGR02452 family protein [Clostridia bacterium]|nr:TIGR02452 family protein [Clostridia bacterium]
MSNIGIKLENDRIFKNGSFPDMVSETVNELSEPADVNRSKPFRISENTVKETTVQCILGNADDKRVIALNFANAMYAGGGYVLGGNAQEESLCRASLLYYTIKTQKKYYLSNRLHVLPDYTDVMIYSENVPVIRSDRGELLEKQLKCDFITCPAVNRSFAKFMMSGKRIDRIMRTRIKRIITLAVMKKPDVLVLGAFGCGMFGNKREKVLPVFEEMINSYVPEDIEVIFAIP